jgi:hypothetical protein
VNHGRAEGTAMARGSGPTAAEAPAPTPTIQTASSDDCGCDSATALKAVTTSSLE